MYISCTYFLNWCIFFHCTPSTLHLTDIFPKMPARYDVNKKIKEGFVHIGKWRKLFSIQDRSYQSKAIRWCLAKEQGFHATFDSDNNVEKLVSTKKTGLVADEMGLGKTFVMLGTWVGNFKKNTLVVLPSALLHQWAKLIKKFLGFEPLVFHGYKSRTSIDKIKQSHIVLTTYGMISPRPKNKKRKTAWSSPLWEIHWTKPTTLETPLVINIKVFQN